MGEPVDQVVTFLSDGSVGSVCPSFNLQVDYKAI